MNNISPTAQCRRLILPAALAALAALTAFASPAWSLVQTRSQARVLADSATILNRNGKWAEAAQLARNTLAEATSLEDRCALRATMIYGLVRSGQLTSGAEALSAYDGECPGAAAAAQWAATIAAVRSEVERRPRVPGAHVRSALANDSTLPPIPTTGFDFSFLPPFWELVDSLSSDRVPSDSLWIGLARSVGFRLMGRIQPDLAPLMSITFMPSMRNARDSVLRRPGTGAEVVAHLMHAASMRDELNAMADSITRSGQAEDAVRQAGRLLPAGVTSGRPAPLVAFALFRNDGTADNQWVLLDLLLARTVGLGPFLAHEFHHVYLGALSTVTRPPPDADDALLVNALINIRNEGIADQIDKPWPLPASQPYASFYNQAYERAPEVLARIDTLLAQADADPTQMRAIALRASQTLPMLGRPVGAYMARSIIQNFGVDSIIATVHSPFAFLRMFVAVERERGNPPPFSPAAQRVLAMLERKYTVRR